APGHQARYPAGYPRRPAGGAGPALVVSRCLSTAGICFLVILSRRGIRLSSRSAYRPTGPDPDGVSTFRTHKLRPGWALSIPRGRRCSPGPATIPSPRLPHLNGTSLHPTTTTIHARLRITKHQREFKQFTRPVFPPPDTPGWNGEHLRLSPKLRTPPLRATHVGAGTGHRARARKTLYDITRTSHLARLLNAYGPA